MSDQTDQDARKALWDAAVEAELRTGTREATPQAARSHLVVRIARVCAGTAVFVAGLILMVLPGPGLLLILAGLSILAVDIPFARRLRDVIVERADKATGFIPRRLKRALVIGGVLIGAAVSAVFVLSR